MPTHRHTDAYTHAHTHACACTHLFMNVCMPVLINSTNIKTKLKAQLEAHCQIYYWLYCELWTAPLILIANFDNWLQRYKEPQVKWNLKRNCFHIYKYMIVVQWFLKSTDTYFPISPSFLSSCLPSPPPCFLSLGWPWTHCVAEDDYELLIPQPLPPKHWNFWHVPLRPAQHLL